MQHSMKSLVFTKDRSKMEVADLPKSTPASDQILVKVEYSALDTVMNYFKNKEIASYFIHDMKSKPLRAEYHFSGTVEHVGKEADFRVGDNVFGHLQYNPKQAQGGIWRVHCGWHERMCH
jgi:NADPH:quinone reductase-like Zn-dependent oxidoreductase